MPITNGNVTLADLDPGECKKPANFKKIDYFSLDAIEKNKAKNLCFTCDVRGKCIQYALENGQIWGIWGGKDENEIRRALSVNSEGDEIRRGRYPQCPYCAARTSKLITKVVDLPDGGRWTTAKAVECTDCGFEWKSRSSANAVNAYHAERKAKAERAAKKAKTMKKAPATAVTKASPKSS